MAIAATTFLLIQVSDPVSVGLGGPIVNKLLDAANVTSVRVPGSPGDTVSLLMVGTFLLATLAATASAVCGVTGGIWLLARWRAGDGPARVGTAMATAGEATREGLGHAHRLGAKGMEEAKPKLVDAAQRSLAAAAHARDGASDRYGEVKPVVRRAARDGRARFDDEVAPRLSTGIRKGTERYRKWIRKHQEEDPDGPGS
jgi:hypothetical protein